MRRAAATAILARVMSLRRLPHVLAPLALLAAGCGAGGSAPSAPPVAAGAVAAPAPAHASRPTPPPGRTLVRLERLDGRFGRHDTLIVGRDGRASLQLAHGGGGFRQAACALDGRSLRGLRRDLARLPVDGRERPVRGYDDGARHDGVIIARPPVYVVTYHGRVQVFGGATMPVDGAPLAARLERVLAAHEGRCRVTFHRP